MVRFYGLCDGKTKVRKTYFVSFFVLKCLVFSQKCWRVLTNLQLSNFNCVYFVK